VIRTRFLCLFGAALTALALAGPSLGDVKITDRQYVTHEGGQDATTIACSTNNRQQNEPTAAVNPTQPAKMTAGANDYCTTPTNGDAWAGFYFSSDNGSSWTNSLLPGYPLDTTAEGQASPLHGLALAAGDPVQAWDRFGNVYYGGIAFNRGRPANASIWVARYSWVGGAMPDYQGTALVARGTPSPIFRGHFNDKVMIEVDRSTAATSGNVYVCWALFTASGPNNGVFFSRSTDGGRTFSNRQKLSDSVHGSQSCDIGVGSTGRVWVAWRQFEFRADSGQRQRDAIAYVYSTDGGRSFTKPAVAYEFIHWDMGDTTGDPAAAGQAGYAACLAGDATLGRCEGPDPRVNARDCGDGPFECLSGYVFGRADSSVHISADPTPGADPDAAYALVDATVPGTQTPTGTSYSTVTDGVGSQASTYLVKTPNGGGSWSTSRVDPQPKGHQFYSDVDAYAGRLHVVYHDTRSDTATGPPGTAADFRTIPFSNQWVGGAVGSTHTKQGVETWYSRSTDGGSTWARQRVSGTSYPLNYEQFGNRDSPFFGDYNFVSASAANVLMAWPSGQDVIAGTDPRYTDGNGTDGFDVLQCRTFSNGVWSADTCPDAGGLDQNIYGFVGP
jgi:hypothetical protein